MLASILLLAAQEAAPTQDLLLPLNQAVEAEWTRALPLVVTPALEADPEHLPVHASLWHFEVEEEDFYRIEMRSLYFTTHLILRDELGNLIDAGEGNLPMGNAVLTGKMIPGQRYQLYAGGSKLAEGSYTLLMTRGQPPTPSNEILIAAMVADGLAREQAIIEKYGPDCIHLVFLRQGLSRALYMQEDKAGVIEVLRRNLDMQVRVHGRDSAELIWSLESLQFFTQQLNRLEEYLEYSLWHGEVAEKNLGPDHATTMKQELRSGLMLKTLGRYDEALVHYQVALERYLRTLGPDHNTVATVYHNIGMALWEAGRFAEAQAAIEEAVRIGEAQPEPGDPRTLSYYLNGLGLVLESVGKLEEARLAMERSLAIRETLDPPDIDALATSLNNLGNLMGTMGDHEANLEYLERAVVVVREGLGPEHMDMVYRLGNLAEVHRVLGNFEIAEDFLDQGLALQRKLFGDEHPVTVRLERRRANLLRSLGRLEEAVAALRAILERQLEWRHPAHPELGQTHGDLGLVLAQMGQRQEAIREYQEALRIQAVAFGPHHPSSSTVAYNLALSLAQHSEVAQALETLLPYAEALYRQSMRVLPGMTESERFRMLAENHRPHLGLISLLLLEGSEEQLRLAMTKALQWKGLAGRVRLQSRARDQAVLPQGVGDLISELRTLQGQVSKAVYAQSSSAAVAADAPAGQKADPDLAENPAGSGSKLDRLRQRGAELEREINRQLARAQGPEVDFAALNQALEPGTAVVSFHRLKPIHQKAPHWIALLHRPQWSAPRWADLGPAEPLEHELERFLAALHGQRGGRPLAEGEDGKPERPLEALLWDPIAPLLEGVDRVVVSPEGVLATLPFQVLTEPNGRYLVERYSFVYLQDLAQLGRPRELQASAQAPSLLAMGAVNFNRRTEGVPAIQEAAPASSLRGRFRRRWPPLPATATETGGVLSMHEANFPNARRRFLADSEATEEALKAFMPGSSIVHLATHGFFAPEGLESMWQETIQEDGSFEMVMERSSANLVGRMPGLLTGLVCAGVNAESSDSLEDGFLTAEEVSWLDLSAVDLVVLSACETGLGRAEAGEGLVGLRRAFRLAGAETVISSLWSVPDRSTQELMEDFYLRMWDDGMPVGAALRQAQLDLLKRNRIENQGAGLPHTWGAFVLSGAWGQP